tara:strand:+ start:3476 stop:4246 length:771 start_codon:yes stop_codon:yes gene_type:complete
MNDRTKAIRRIQKLKALAEGELKSGNSKAAESAVRIAARLMLEHAIAEAEVAASIDDDPVVERGARTGKVRRWTRTLYANVAKANNCTLSYRTKTDAVTFYGTASDCEIAEYLAAYLVKAVSKEADIYMRKARQSAAKKTEEARVEGAFHQRVFVLRKGLRTDFCHSAVVSLGRRLRAIKREAAAEARAAYGDESVGTALIVLNNKLARAEDYQDRLGFGNGPKNKYQGVAAGHAAGDGININKGLSGDTAKAVTG